MGSTHTAMVGAYVSQEAADEIFSSDVDAVVAGQLAPLGQARRVDGGLVASGRLGYASGIHQSEWTLSGCVVEAEGDAAPEARLVVIPSKSVDVADTLARRRPQRHRELRLLL